MYVCDNYVRMYTDSPSGTPSSPVLTYKNTLNEILVSWSPVDSDTMCGPVTYNITVMPSHGMIMMISDTVHNITGLHYNTNYTITVYAANNYTSGEPATVTVKTLPGTYVMCIYARNDNYKLKIGIKKLALYVNTYVA